MFVTQIKYNKMKDRIINLEGQVEALTKDRTEERNKKLKEILNLDDKIILLEKDKRKLQNDVNDKVSESKRADEEIQHRVKIVLEKHDLELEKEKQKLILEKDKEIAKVKDKYRDKTEVQLDKRGSEMKEMYNTVLDKLTTVAGTISNPAGIANNGNNK